jgi:hypothetical protein
MTRLIVEIPKDNSPASSMAAEYLRSRADVVGCEYKVELAEYLNRKQVGGYGGVYKLPISYHLLETLPGVTAFEAVARIAREHNDRSGRNPPHGYVERIEIDRHFHLSTTAKRIGTGFTLGGEHSNYLSDLDVAAAHATTKGSGTRVAILDTGIDPAILKPASFRDLVSDPPSLVEVDGNGHGTAMAKIIKSVAPAAEIHVIRVAEDDSTTLWEVMAGISTAVFESQAHLINLSLGFKELKLDCTECGASGTTVSKTFEDLIRALDATQPGPKPPPRPVLIAAAGNESSGALDYPAGFAAVLGVGSVYKASGAYERSPFSNYTTARKDAHVLLPGGDDTPDPAGNPSQHVGTGSDAGATSYCYGTSAATAYATGLLALYRCLPAHDRQTPDELLDDMIGKCDSGKISSYDADEDGAGFFYYQP